MKEKELRKHTTCSVCENKIMHTGLPLFWILDIKRYGLIHENIKRQDGLAQFIGSTGIAQIMGENADVAKIVLEKKITLCEKCAEPIFVLLEKTKINNAGKRKMTEQEEIELIMLLEIEELLRGIVWN